MKSVRIRLNSVRCVSGIVSMGMAVCATLGAAAYAQVASDQNVPPLIQQMVGTWSVQQRMWPGAGAAPANLPPAIAHRRLLGNAFLEEVMEPAAASGSASKEDAFTRVAYFNYNTVNQRYEYVSMDSRAPQIMNERGAAGPAAAAPAARGLVLHGGKFVAPKWGDATNVAFTYRLTVLPVEKDRQTVRLYLTPQSGATPKEFLAFEYVYTKSP